MLRRLWDMFLPGGVMFPDRLMCTWTEMVMLKQRGVESVYTYDKRLYDRRCDRHAKPVREHFGAGVDTRTSWPASSRTTTNCESPPTFPPEIRKAAAVITYLSPGLRFLHKGEFDGRKKHVSPHLCREPDEPIDQDFKQFYDQLLAVLRAAVVPGGRWQSLDCVAAWDGNWTSDCFNAFAWQGPDDKRLLVVVNYADNQSECFVRIPFTDLGRRTWRMDDRLGKATYACAGNRLQSQGLFVDLGRWKYHVLDRFLREFEVHPVTFGPSRGNVASDRDYFLVC